jgi:hypothetical protein
MLSAFGDRNKSFKSEAAGLGAGLPQQYIEDRLCHACYELMANPVISEYLVELFWEEAFNHRVLTGEFITHTNPKWHIAWVCMLGPAWIPIQVPDIHK